jgi:hypothetical protein
MKFFLKSGISSYFVFLSNTSDTDKGFYRYQHSGRIIFVCLSVRKLKNRSYAAQKLYSAP